MKRHPYILTTAIATLLAIAVWLCIPKTYTAITKVSDEYKETDLAIGLSEIQAHLRNVSGGANKGMNDMRTYCKLLNTEDFIRFIAQKHVPNKNITYGCYLGKSDTIETVRDHINYYYSSKYETLTISFTDRIPLVAAQMLDSVTAHLQEIITAKRHAMAKILAENAKIELDSATLKYHQAQEAYASFTDSNTSLTSKSMEQKRDALEKEVSIAYDQYRKATNQYIRQIALQKRAYASFSVLISNTTPNQQDTLFIGILLAFVFTGLILTKGIVLYKQRKDFLNNLEFGDFFSPWTITISLWTVIISLIWAVSDKLYPLTSQFYISISIWISIFCTTSFLTYNLMGISKEKQSLYAIHINKGIFWAFLLFSIFCTPLCLKKVIDIVLMFGSENLMASIRLLVVSGDAEWGILAYSFIINKILLIVSLWAYPKTSRWTIILTATLTLLNSLAIMDKGTIFFILLVFIFVMYERNVISKKTIFVSGICIIGLFFILTIMRSWTDESGKSTADDLTLFEFLGIYVLANSVAFSYMNRPITHQFGAFSLSLIYIVLNKFGGNYPVNNLIMDFSYVPIVTNQYTIMQPFYADFGYYGVAFFALIYGLMNGWAYNKYRNGIGFGYCIYTYLMVLTTLQFGQEDLFLTPVIAIQLVIFTYIITQNKFNLIFLRPKTSK